MRRMKPKMAGAMVMSLIAIGSLSTFASDEEQSAPSQKSVAPVTVFVGVAGGSVAGTAVMNSRYNTGLKELRKERQAVSAELVSVKEQAKGPFRAQLQRVDHQIARVEKELKIQSDPIKKERLAAHLSHLTEKRNIIERKALLPHIPRLQALEAKTATFGPRAARLHGKIGFSSSLGLLGVVASFPASYAAAKLAESAVCTEVREKPRTLSEVLRSANYDLSHPVDADVLE